MLDTLKLIVVLHPQSYFWNICPAFILTCNYSPDNLPVKLSRFHQQSLLSWKLCFTHGFSPHKTLLWNNECITIRYIYIFDSKWFERSVNNILSVLNEHSFVLSYESFISRQNFPIPFREYNSVIKAIPSSLLNLLKSHLSFCEGIRPGGSSVLLLNGINIQGKECSNRGHRLGKDMAFTSQILYS